MITAPFLPIILGWYLGSTVTLSLKLLKAYNEVSRRQSWGEERRESNEHLFLKLSHLYLITPTPKTGFSVVLAILELRETHWPLVE